MLSVIILAAFLFTALVPVSAYAFQEESEQEARSVEKKTAGEIQPAGQESAEKSLLAEPEAEKTGETAEEEIPEVIVPAPKNQKEAVGIYVFLVWVWLSIFVLIYVLRLKVKESDRIHQLKFFSKDKE